MSSAYPLPSVADDLMEETHVPSIETYRAALRSLPAGEWEPYLLAHSNLSGPRGNLELAQAAADMGAEAQFRRWAGLGPDVAPENTPQCFLAFCGVVGLGAVMARRGGFPLINAPTVVNGRSAVDGRLDVARENPPLRLLRTLAADPRWRIREAVAMALQRWGDADMPGLLAAMADWARGTPWEQRAAAAALCEPRLLKDAEHAAAVLCILDEITASIPQIGRVQDAPPGVGLLLERGRGRAAGRRQAADGEMARQP
jgi:hypothetical protein